MVPKFPGLTDDPSIFLNSLKSKKPHISVKLLRGEYRIRTDDPYTASVVL